MEHTRSNFKLRAKVIAYNESAADLKAELLQTGDLDSDSDTASPLHEYQKSASKSLPPTELSMIFLMYFFTLAASFIRGGKGVPSILGIVPCSHSYWTFTAGFAAICVGIMGITSVMLIRKFAKQVAIGYQFEEDDMAWTYKNCQVVLVVSLGTGLICGMLGLTGGVFLGPMLLVLKVKTEVANATCSFVVAFSSSVAFVQYAAAGMVNYQYGMWYSLWSSTGAFFGVFIMEKLMKNSGKSSPAVYILTLVLGMSAVLIPIHGYTKVMEMVARGKFELNLRDFC